MLKTFPQLESAGVVVRMPAAWKANRPPRPQVTAQVGGHVPSRLGHDALLDFRMEVVLNGETFDRHRGRAVAGRVRRTGTGSRPLG